MAKQGNNNVKLGVFVMAGLLVMMVFFYMIGSNKNMFGNSFVLKVRFANLNGLMEGNNVLFSGIQAGTVKSISIVNDTTIEVTMLIDSKVKGFIHNNAQAVIGTEGLMGNKVVNILPSKISSPLVVNGEMLQPQKIVSMDEMMQTLSKTNINIATISEVLKNSVQKLDTSAIFDVLNDKNIGVSVRSSLKNINTASQNASYMTHELVYGKGPLHALLRDSTLTKHLNISMANIQKGTDGFDSIVEALKHNFLVKGYFKTQEKQKADSVLNSQKKQN